jgi:hypothetical protein
MATLTKICHDQNKGIKVIFENCYLTKEEIKKCAEIAKEVKPDFIKTSTGFGTGGATIEDVKLMKDTVGSDVEVKAGYEFHQMDQGVMNFVLHPENIVILGGYGAPLSVRIEFSQNFGGDAEIYSQFMMFNISPTELWIDNERSEDFSRKLFSQLRQERNRLANEKNIPAYLIFKNVTLTEMARQMPQDAKTMESITGVTSEKFRLYGDHFLAVIWKYKSDTEKLKKRNSAS